jgi:hypothetical protein
MTLECSRRRVGKGTRTFQLFGNNRGWAGRDCSPRSQRRSDGNRINGEFERTVLIGQSYMIYSGRCADRESRTAVPETFAMVDGPEGLRDTLLPMLGTDALATAAWRCCGWSMLGGNGGNGRQRGGPGRAEKAPPRGALSPWGITGRRRTNSAAILGEEDLSRFPSGVCLWVVIQKLKKII